MGSMDKRENPSREGQIARGPRSNDAEPVYAEKVQIVGDTGIDTGITGMTPARKFTAHLMWHEAESDRKSAAVNQFK